MTTTALHLLPRNKINLGCDPEFFFKNEKGHVIGSEHIIPEKGLDYPNGSKPFIVIDGVQAELNPPPVTCRESLAYYIHSEMLVLKNLLDKKHKNVKVSFDRSIKMTKTELNKLCEKNKQLGCSPSLNAYGDNTELLKGVDGAAHLQRSAGGHIHLGISHMPVFKSDPASIVMLLDIICGNTCVLIDRDKGNAKRRKLYGLAGEFRLPNHGLEYRTLSNFWMHHYALMSLAFGLARLAVEASKYPQITKAFMDAVKINDVRKAINTNNYHLALKNFEKIAPLIEQVTGMSGGHYPFDAGNIKNFKHFAETVNQKGLEYYFPEDSFKHWTTLHSTARQGFHSFLNNAVARDMAATKNKAA